MFSWRGDAKGRGSGIFLLAAMALVAVGLLVASAGYAGAAEETLARYGEVGLSPEDEARLAEEIRQEEEEQCFHGGPSEGGREDASLSHALSKVRAT